jgi:alanine dehydrogenase
MRVGIPKEVKNHEYRVAITPAGVHELVSRGHEVAVEAGAGLGSSIPDDEYVHAGAKIVDSADALWEQSELVLKVKEPIEEEFHRLREDLTLFTYLHLAASRPSPRRSCVRAPPPWPTRRCSCPAVAFRCCTR